MAYMALFVDGYPPFGEGAYPVSIDVQDPVGACDPLRIAIRIVLAIPHFPVLALLLVGWLVTTVIAWFAILFTGRYPSSLYPFGAGVMQWALRVEALHAAARRRVPSVPASGTRHECAILSTARLVSSHPRAPRILPGSGWE